MDMILFLITTQFLEMGIAPNLVRPLYVGTASIVSNRDA
jgi:hypothetical protein